MKRLGTNLSDRLIDNLLKIEELPAHMREQINERTATDLDNKIVDTIVNRGAALAVTNAKRMFFDPIKSGAYFLKFEVSKSQAMFNGIGAFSLLFSLTGVSFEIARKSMEYSEKIAHNMKYGISTYFLKYTQTIVEVYLGGSHFEFDENVVDSALIAGDLFIASAYLLFSGLFYIELGKFNTVEKIIIIIMTM